MNVNIPPHPPTPSYVVPGAGTSLYIHTIIYNYIYIHICIYVYVYMYRCCLFYMFLKPDLGYDNPKCLVYLDHVSQLLQESYGYTVGTEPLTGAVTQGSLFRP